jgi:deoxyribodipyrimidine photo-lyase
MWNRRYEPASIARDSDIKQAFKDKGLAAESYHASLLLEPWEVSNQQGQPFKVFTPFWKHCLSKLPPAPPLSAPTRLSAPQPLRPCDDLRDWRLLPTQPDWAGGMREAWQVGEAAAMTRLQTFLEDGLQRYDGGRDIPSEANTSRLSPYLHFGEISPRQVWHQVMERAPQLGAHVSKYLSELGWREFAHHLLYHFPSLPERPFNAKFEAFAWQTNPQHWAAWCKGETGYPLVDAGMRELWHTGWMHNRVRMVVASFLTKHLRIAWHEGQTWFWDTLVDANLANNSASWQWVAGCGADAAPYFRIFNPFTQSEKFDPQGTYIRRWVPELRGLGAQEIHKPWSHAPRYARPIVVHEEARQAALAAYQDLK